MSILLPSFSSRPSVSRFPWVFLLPHGVHFIASLVMEFWCILLTCPIHRHLRFISCVLDVVCCHLIDRPQSVPQLPYNRTLHFPKTLRLNINAIFHGLITQLYHSETRFNVICIQFYCHCKEIFACSCPRLHSCCGEWEGGL